MPVDLGTFNGIGNIGITGKTNSAAINSFTLVLSIIIGVLTVSAAIWFTFQIFSGALQWLTSGGDKQSLENARKRLTHAVIGLFIVVLSYAIISLFGLIFGLDIIHLGNLINGLTV